MKSFFRTFFTRIIPIILIMISLVFLLYLGYLKLNENSIGKEIGRRTGSAVGKLVGSLKGMTVGKSEGTEAGKEEGLSAEDTNAIIANELKKVNKLEVLVASVKLTNFHSIGENTGYASLYLANGTIVFSIDLNKAIITQEKDTLHILLPMPEGELFIDDSKIEQVAEWQKNFFGGSDVAGYKATINSMKQLMIVSEETLSNYSELMQSAQDAADTQVTQLVKATSLITSNVDIDFDLEGEE